MDRKLAQINAGVKLFVLKGVIDESLMLVTQWIPSFCTYLSKCCKECPNPVNIAVWAVSVPAGKWTACLRQQYPLPLKPTRWLDTSITAVLAHPSNTWVAYICIQTYIQKRVFSWYPCLNEETVACWTKRVFFRSHPQASCCLRGDTVACPRHSCFFFTSLKIKLVNNEPSPEQFLTVFHRLLASSVETTFQTCRIPPSVVKRSFGVVLVVGYVCRWSMMDLWNFTPSNKAGTMQAGEQ